MRACWRLGQPAGPLHQNSPPAILNKRDQNYFDEMTRKEALNEDSDRPNDNDGRRDDDDGCCDARHLRTTAAATVAPPQQQISTIGVTQQLLHYGQFEWNYCSSKP